MYAYHRILIIAVIFLLTAETNAATYQGWHEETLSELSISDYVPSMYSSYTGRDQYSCILSNDCEMDYWEVIMAGNSKIVYCNSRNVLEEYYLTDHDVYYLIQDCISDVIAISIDRYNGTIVELISRDNGSISEVLTSDMIESQAPFVACYEQDNTIYFATYEGTVGCWSESDGLAEYCLGDGEIDGRPLSELVYGTKTGCIVVSPLDWAYDYLINWDSCNGILYQRPICDYSGTNTLVDVSISGNIVCMQSDDNGLVVIDGGTGNEISAYCDDYRIRTLCVSPSGEYLSVGYSISDADQASQGTVIECINLNSDVSVHCTFSDQLNYSLESSVYIHETTNEGYVLAEVRENTEVDTPMYIVLFDSRGVILWRSDSFISNNNIMNTYCRRAYTEATCSTNSDNILISYINTANSTLVNVKIGK